MKPQLLIGSPFSGSGKTTFTLGLLRLLQRKGLNVQPFKCGPECADTLFHAVVSDSESANLDSWFVSDVHIRNLYNKYSENADICIIEGMSGLFDGYKRMQGSSADIARLLQIPIVLIVNANAIAYSVAPLLYGFKRFRPSVNIVGVVFNQVASEFHFKLLREACMDAGIECLGYLPFAENLKLPVRHSGFTLATKQSVNELADRVALLIEQHIDLNKLLNMCIRTFPCPHVLPYNSELELDPVFSKGNKPLRIAIARDPAFCLLFRENIDILSRKGKLTFFSPIYENNLPEADLIYLPGGYPELFARQLSRRKRLLEQLRDYAEKGGKILAECGGMVLLSHSLTIRSGGSAYEMANLFPFEFSLSGSRVGNGYRRANYKHFELRGYESHYTYMTSTPENVIPFVKTYTLRGVETSSPLYRYKNVIAGLTRWYWGDNDIITLWENQETLPL